MPFFPNSVYVDDNNVPSGFEDIQVGIHLNYVFDGQNWIRYNPSGVGFATEATLEEINNKLVDGNDIGDVTVNNPSGVGAVNIQDGGNSITVDVPSLPLPSGAATETTLSNINNKLVNGNDIGDVTINNISGSGAVNVQDGGNSLSIDDGGNALMVKGDLPEGAAASGTSPVLIAFKDIFGGIATPTALNVVGFNVVPNLLIDGVGNLLSITNSAIFCGGDEAHDAVDAGNPIKTGGKATSGVPTAVANNDRVNARFNTIGQQITTLAGYSTGDPVDIEDDKDGRTGLNTQPLLQRSDYVKCMSSQVFDNINVNTDVFGGEELPCKRGSEIEIYVTIDSLGTGNHNIQLGFEFSLDDGTTWFRVDHGFEQAIWFEDVETASGINRCYVIPSRGDRMRVFGRSRNTTALLTFTVDIFAKERTNP